MRNPRWFSVASIFLIYHSNFKLDEYADLVFKVDAHIKNIYISELYFESRKFIFKVNYNNEAIVPMYNFYYLIFRFRQKQTCKCNFRGIMYPVAELNAALLALVLERRNKNINK